MKKLIKIILAITIFTQLSFASSEKIKIDIISDVVCPWCAIGYQRLSTAIDELDLKDKVDITWHPFQLNPNMPREGLNADEYLKDKYNLSDDKLKQTRNNVTNLGKQSGFKFDYFKEMRKLNTFNSHILLDYAKKFGKQTELKVRLQNAYFGERKDISNRDVLFKELQAVGLNAKEAMKTLDNDEYIKRVENEENFWRAQGVYAIPTMVFNNQIAKVGASKVEDYKEILTKMLENNK